MVGTRNLVWPSEAEGLVIEKTGIMNVADDWLGGLKEFSGVEEPARF